MEQDRDPSSAPSSVARLLKPREKLPSDFLPSRLHSLCFSYPTPPAMGKAFSWAGRDFHSLPLLKQTPGCVLHVQVHVEENPLQPGAPAPAGTGHEANYLHRIG